MVGSVIIPLPTDRNGNTVTSHALRGLRVLDLADRSAALTGRILADLGAEVIMVEPPGGNSIRRLAPFLDDGPVVDDTTVSGNTAASGNTAGPERSFAHQYFSANKSSVIFQRAAVAGAG